MFWPRALTARECVWAWFSIVEAMDRGGHSPAPANEKILALFIVDRQYHRSAQQTPEMCLFPGFFSRDRNDAGARRLFVDHTNGHFIGYGRNKDPGKFRLEDCLMDIFNIAVLFKQDTRNRCKDTRPVLAKNRDNDFFYKCSMRLWGNRERRLRAYALIRRNSLAIFIIRL